MLRAVVVVLLLANVGFWAWTKGWLAPLWMPPHHGEREPERLQAQVNPQRLKIVPLGAGGAGAAGPAGAAGSSGAVGPAGAAGTPGTAGTAGATGPAATAGTPGPAGTAAPAATAGATAAAGPGGTAAASAPAGGGPGVTTPATNGALPPSPGAAAAAASATATVCLETLPMTAADATAGAAALAAAGVPPARWQRVTAASAQAPWLVYTGPFSDLSARRTVLAQWRRLGLAVETVDAPAALAPGLLLSRHGSRASAEVALSGLPESVLPLARVVAAPAGAAALVLRIAAADAALLAQLRTLAPPWGGAFRPCADAGR